MSKFVNLMGDKPLTRNTFEAFKVINIGVESGDEVAISFTLNVETGESSVDLIAGIQSEVTTGTGKVYTDNDANGKFGINGFMGSQYLPALADGLFEQGLDLVEDTESEPLIWVACTYFALANNIKNKLMILPLDDGFLVALQEGVIRFPREDQDDLVLARNIGNRDVDSMTFMTSSPGNIQGVPESELYNQSFMSLTLQRKIQHIITRKSARQGNDDKGLTTSVAFDRFGTVLLDGGSRLRAQLAAEADAAAALEKRNAEQAIEREAAELRQDANLAVIAEKKGTSSELRERAAVQLAAKGYRNPLAAMFLDAQKNKA